MGAFLFEFYLCFRFFFLAKVALSLKRRLSIKIMYVLILNIQFNWDKVPLPPHQFNFLNYKLGKINEYLKGMDLINIFNHYATLA